MSTTLIKPRWEAWENICIQRAFTQKIQHKIMAAALGRTVSSVSKKIKALGLRASSSKPGQIKGKRQTLPRIEKTPRDLATMIEILKTYAPLQCFQRGHLALKKGCWTNSKPTLSSDQNEGMHLEPINCYDLLFSFVKPLEFITSMDPIFKASGAKKIPRDPTHVSLQYIDQWATSEGFHRLGGTLRHQGLSYWKEGTYFSQTQLLMHVNRLRFEHNLQPIALIEEERESPT